MTDIEAAALLARVDERTGMILDKLMTIDDRLCSVETRSQKQEVRVDRLERWREGLDNMLRLFGLPLLIAMVLQLLFLIGGLLTNRIDIVVH